MTPPPRGRVPGTVTDEAILADIERLMRRMSDWHTHEFLSIDVTMPQAKVLQILAADAPATMSSLATRLDVGPSTISGVVDRLVEHGLVRRDLDAADRRQVMVALTPAGDLVVERFRELGSNPLRRLLRALSPEERVHLAIGVAALADHAEHMPLADLAGTDPDVERTAS